MTRTPASGAERALHWTVAATVLVMLATGLVLYVPALGQAIGLRFWVRSAHLAAAAGLLLALAVAGGTRRAEMRALERELSRWQRPDLEWFLQPWSLLRGEPLPPSAPTGRFNGGQKLFAALAALALAVLLLTGTPMYWWSWFGARLVSRARDLHLVAAFALTALLAGHVYLGLLSPREAARPSAGEEAPSPPGSEERERGKPAAPRRRGRVW
ncbi:MAG TPA: cytochrome b/b6 domain-containing protein [Candidatus Dormibacteraeota bacterium]|nr:cytochrome b/b6 domain-containing protein [Candidatus Dormibacteraeota bacterium]